MPFTFTSGAIEDLVVIEPRVFTDDRGFFMETFKATDFRAAGISAIFAQENHSRSRKGTLRGLHFQRPPFAQGKLIRVLRGKVWDVAVDLRDGSRTFGASFGLELSEVNRKMLWIPQGFAHGFLAMEEDTEFEYLCTGEYNAASEGGIRWNDPLLAVSWPDLGFPPSVSPKDSFLPFLKDVQGKIFA